MLVIKQKYTIMREKYNLPAVDVTDGGASRLLDVIIDYIGDFKK